MGETLAGRAAGASALAKAEQLKASRAKGILRRFRKAEDWSWRVGAAGERRVGRELARLPQGWYVFHDIPIGTRGANIDHLVVGPGGVFSLNTKNLSGKVWVAERTFLHNGHRTDFLPRSHREAQRVAKLLGAALGRPVPVAGVLVVMCRELTVKAQPRDVAVIRRGAIRDWLVSRPTCFAPGEVLEIAGSKEMGPLLLGRLRRISARRTLGPCVARSKGSLALSGSS